MRETGIIEISNKKHLEITADGRVLIIAINNPPENMLHRGIFIELDSCRDSILSPDVDVIIFTGKGNMFSKGVSVEEIESAANASELRQNITYANDFYNFIDNLEKPVIAAINGHALGGGLELALVCHIRLCSEKARLGLPEVSRGIIPGLGGIQRLTQVVGEGKSLEMILLGDIIPAYEALRLNLVNRVLPKEGFMPKVLAYAKTLLMCRQDCVREIIRLIRLSRTDREENIRAAVEAFINLKFGYKR